MKTVLITGAAGGIGYHLSWYFLGSGHKVIMLDIDENGLKEASHQLERFFDKRYFETECVDITDLDQINNFIEGNTGSHKYDIDILINNAGIGQHSTLINTDTDRLSKLMEINFFGPEKLIKAVIPGMLERGHGQIVNICSGQVFFNLPAWAAYTCTKAALASYSEALYHELKPYGIHVTTAYPFMVNTGFYDDVNAKTLGGRLSMRLLPFYSMKPEKVAKIIFNATMKKKRKEMVSLLNYAGQAISISPPISKIVGSISNYFLTEKVPQKPTDEQIERIVF